MQTIIEIEFKKNDVARGLLLATKYNVFVEIKGSHPDGLVTLRFTGNVEKLEQLVESEKPGDEFEAYLAA